MKLIVDISEDDYNNIEPFLNGQTIKGGFNLFKALEIFKNGTPLDEVKAEIVKEIDEYKNRQLALAIGVEDLEKGKQTALNYVMAILDKIIPDNTTNTRKVFIKTVTNAKEAENYPISEDMSKSIENGRIESEDVT